MVKVLKIKMGNNPNSSSIGLSLIPLVFMIIPALNFIVGLIVGIILFLRNKKHGD